MTLTYERDVLHCSPTKYVRDVTIKEVLPANNSDNLDRIIFEEIGWNAISRRGSHKVGDVIFFIPPESVLPLELSDALGVTSYLSKGRVRAIKLRGNRSEGLIVDKIVAEPYLEGILQWEDPPSRHMGGEQLPNAIIPILAFPVFVKMPNIMNEPDTFSDGDKIAVSEKIHGTNIRFGIHPHPETDEPTLYVGSHNVVLKESEKNLYWQAVRKHINTDKLPYGITFYGEVYGKGIQDLHYDSDMELRVFAACKNGWYLPIKETMEICDEYNIPRVIFEFYVYSDIEWARELADRPSFMTDSHVREGIVIREMEHKCDGENYNFRIAKVIGMSYMTRKGEKTERH